MKDTTKERCWVRINLPSDTEISMVRQEFQAEILRSTLRRINKGNLLIEALIPMHLVEKLKTRYAVSVFGDVDRMVREAARYVSRKNRYG